MSLYCTRNWFLRGPAHVLQASLVCLLASLGLTDRQRAVVGTHVRDSLAATSVLLFMRALRLHVSQPYALTAKTNYGSMRADAF
jgi:hypothetical protein